MTKYKLGEIIELNPRESIKKGNIARKIAMDDLGEFKRDIESYSYSEYKGGTKFRNYDTLMARITPCLENGKTSFVNILEENEVAFGSTEYFVFRAKQDIINPYYLYYLVTTDKFREVAIKSMSGTSGRQRVQKDQILDFSVDLPSLEDQEKIMKPLKLIDDKISLNTKLNTNLLELLDTEFTNQFINSDLPIGKVNDFVSIKRGSSPRPIKNFLSDKGRAWIKISDVTKLTSPFLYDTAQSIKESGIDKSRTIKPGTLILSNSATPGIPIISEILASVHDGWLIVDHYTHMDRNWFYLFFRQMRRQLIARANGSVFNNLKTDIVKDFPVPIAKEEELLKFKRISNPIFDKLDKLQQENIVLSKLKDILLKQYF